VPSSLIVERVRAVSGAARSTEPPGSDRSKGSDTIVLIVWKKGVSARELADRLYMKTLKLFVVSAE
jgi:hypothetical protein